MPILAVAAVAGGAAVATGVMAASTVAMIGVAATVVGKVTKSKELMQIGGGLSLGAGIASVATSVFGAAEGASAAAGTAAEGAAASGAAEGVSGAAGTIEGAEAAGAALEGIGSSAAQGATTAGLGEAASSAASAAGETGGLLSAGGSAGNIGTPVIQLGDASGLAQSAAQGIGNTVTNAVVAPASTTSSGISGWWNGLSESTKNKLLQVGGQAASGAMEGWTTEQKLAFERERQRLEQERYNTSQRNANAQPIVRFAPVQPSAGILTPKRG